MLQGRLGKIRHSLDWLGCSTSTYAFSLHLPTSGQLEAYFVHWSSLISFWQDFRSADLYANTSKTHMSASHQPIPPRKVIAVTRMARALHTDHTAGDDKRHDLLYLLWTSLGVIIKSFRGLPSTVELRCGGLFAPILVGSLGFGLFHLGPFAAWKYLIWGEGRQHCSNLSISQL